MAEPDKAFRENLEAILALAKNREGAKNILGLLFPKADSVLKTYTTWGSTDRRDRKFARRLSEKEFSSTYFSLDPSPLVWSRQEIDQIVSAIDPSELLLEAQRRIESVREYDRPQLRSMLLEALDAAFANAPSFNAVWLAGFVKFSPYFITHRDQSPEFFASDNMERMTWLLRTGADRLDTDARYSVFSEVVQLAEDLTILARFIRFVTSDTHPDNEERQRERPIFFGELESKIRSDLLGRVELLAANGSLWQQADLGPILWFWWGCDRESEVRSFTNSGLKNPNWLRRLLETPISLIRSTAGNYETVPKYWSKIIDLEVLEKSASRLMMQGEAADRHLATRFIGALERGRKERD